MARDILFTQLAFNDHLCRDAGMVGAGLPKGILAIHPVVPDQDILKRESKRMPHMEAAGHVGRRHHNDIGIGA